jgi:acetyl-CoA carboxylase biotin carboxyl carrier protein
MNAKELKAMLQALSEHEVGELTLETPDYKLTVRRGAMQVQVVAAPETMAAPVASPAPVAPTPAVAPVAPVPAAPAPRAEEPVKGTEVKAPIVGTFYRAPGPDADPFVKEGDTVRKGQVLCIIEAMKLMNEIESEVAGVVRKVLVGNAEPVEFGQALFLIEPA